MKGRIHRPSPAMAVALLALFVSLGGVGAYAANTIRSTDIVDGEVKNADLAPDSVSTSKLRAAAVNNSDLAPSGVTGAKVKDDTLTGADVHEDTLGSVPSARSLGGVYAHEFRPGTAHATQRTDQCAVVGGWRECAPVTLTVPHGETYKVDVHASMTAWGASNSVGFFCAASEGPSCVTGIATAFTIETNKYTQISHSGTGYFTGGTHRFNAAVRIDGAIGAAGNGMSTVTIRWHDKWAESASMFGAAPAAVASGTPEVSGPGPRR
jgi:hypothetical protein